MTTDAERLAAAFTGGGLLTTLANRPTTVAEGYTLQDSVRSLLGKPIVGWKLAQTTAAAQEANGITAPTVAPLLEGMIVPDETVFPAGKFYKPEGEAEIVIELAEPLDGKATREKVTAAAAGFRLAIEMADTRYTDKPAMGVPAVIGDMNSSAALVIGALEPISSLGAALDAAVTLRLGDGTIVPKVPEPMKPDPIGVVVFLTEFLSERGHTLPAGSIITTGTHTPPTRSAPGLVVAEFGSVGRVSARLSEPNA